MDVLKAISERSSYRGSYKDTPVSKEDLRAIMEAGLAAPSGCNTQTTSLIAVNDPDLLAHIRQLTQSPMLETAPAVICVLTQRLIAYRDRSFYVQDYAAAIENMLLAAVGLGYQSCWIEGQITDRDAIGRKIADLLDVPDEYEMVCILPVGIAADSVKKAKKKPFSQRAWFNGFKTV